jgi:hypothetical protein
VWNEEMLACRTAMSEVREGERRERVREEKPPQ